MKEQDQALQLHFNRHYGINTNIDDTEIQRIYTNIKKHLETVKEINEIVAKA